MIPFYFSIGGLNVAIIDLIVLIVLIIAIIVGAVRGFAKQILGILGLVAAVIIAYFICEPVAEFVKTTFPKISEAISSWIASISGLGDIAQLTPENAEEILNNSEIPVFLHGLVINLVNESKILEIIPTLTDLAIKAMTFVVLVIVLLIAFAIFKKLFLWIAKLKFIRPVDKTLGAIFGVLVCVIILIIVFALLLMIAQDFTVNLLEPTITEGVTFESLTSKLLGLVLQLPFISNLIAMGF